MRRIGLLLIGMACVLTSYTQSTYSRIMDYNEDDIGTKLVDMVVADDAIYTLSHQVCNRDSFLTYCAGYGRFDRMGYPQVYWATDSIDARYTGYDQLAYRDGRLYHAYTPEYSKNDGIILKAMGDDLVDGQAIYTSGTTEDTQYLSEGLLIDGDYAYIYGIVTTSGGNRKYAEVIKITLQGQEVWRKKYDLGHQFIAGVPSLQVLDEQSLLLTLEVFPGFGATDNFGGYELVKIDTAGNIMDSFAFDNKPTESNRVLALSGGGYVFASVHHPFDGQDIFTTGYGLINKLDPEMDTLEWSIILPNDQLVDGREYVVYDYIEASNGDVVAFGRARDDSDKVDPAGGADMHTTWNGWIIRITPEGETKWMHLYKAPNDLLDNDAYGRFRPSVLTKIEELSDGRLLVGGQVPINQLQELRLIDNGWNYDSEIGHLWLMAVDSEGCLDGYPCEEIIRLRRHAAEIDHNIGDRWIYETESYIGNGDVQTSYQSIAIEDSVIDSDGLVKYAFGQLDTFYVRDNRMFFWDEYYEEYVMYFDFDAMSSYTIKYYDQFRESEEVATVLIDSISYYRFSDGDSIRQQHVRILNSGLVEGEYSDIIYGGIGTKTGGVRPLLGCGLCDPDPVITHLRCFLSQDKKYQFVPYACDSSFIITSISEVTADKLSIVPNPTTSSIRVQGDWSVSSRARMRVHDVYGRIVIDQWIHEGVEIDLMDHIASMFSQILHVHLSAPNGEVLAKERVVLLP